MATKLKSRRSARGIGLYINPDSGSQVLHPGMTSSVVIDEGRSTKADLNTRFAIPNENELRKEKRKQVPIKADGESSKLKKVASKPFKAPRGSGQQDSEATVLRRSPRRKNVGSTVGSTTTS
ncbi:uncharacterized protein LOC131010467 [Salvia miltiorrhiza]|uniref:uncharacterized protein LOC131010467 n=1 Tax=Salvia miltiorrhiza TaxID=226208 RepID=UPI0025ACD38B|nr:uncharacterized protein LOC131010467 [Salvia miltiorrhiza]